MKRPSFSERVLVIRRFSLSYWEFRNAGFLIQVPTLSQLLYGLRDVVFRQRRVVEASPGATPHGGLLACGRALLGGRTEVAQ